MGARSVQFVNCQLKIPHLKFRWVDFYYMCRSLQYDTDTLRNLICTNLSKSDEMG